MLIIHYIYVYAIRELIFPVHIVHSRVMYICTRDNLWQKKNKKIYNKNDHSITIYMIHECAKDSLKGLHNFSIFINKRLRKRRLYDSEKFDI